MARRSEPVSKFEYEGLRSRLLPWPLFLYRAVAHFVVGSAGVVIAITIGTTGYHWIGRLPWVDAFLNASMILSGMGPVDQLHTTAAKIFAALYALFSGLMFIALMSVVMAPWLHRLLHRLHLAEDETTTSSDRKGT